VFAMLRLGLTYEGYRYLVGRSSCVELVCLSYAQIEVERLRLQDIWFASSNQANTKRLFEEMRG
jgi:hypothetical protein